MQKFCNAPVSIWLCGSLPGIVLLIFWEYAANNSGKFKFFFASPAAIWTYTIDAYGTADFWQDVYATGSAAIIGLALGAIFGVISAIVFWLHKKVAQIVAPYLLVLGAIPIFAIAPILIILFGIDLWSKIIIAGIGVFFATLPACFAAMKTLAQEHVLFCQMVKANWRQQVRLVLLPHARGWIVQSLQRNINVAVLGVFIGEFISANRGIAHQILADSQSYNMPGVWFGIIQLCLLTGILHLLLRRLDR